MQSLNVLLIGNCERACKQLLQSKMLNKLYISASQEIKGTIDITFNSVEELVNKCNNLQIDFVIISDLYMMQEGLVNILKQRRINCIGVNRIWTDILSDDLCARKLTNRYKISKPLILKYPKEFPVIIKNEKDKKIASSMDDLLRLKESMQNDTETYIEEYITGEEIVITSLFDGKNLLNFPVGNISENQQNKLQTYCNKLKIMLNSEKADFIGFINSRLIWYKGDWYNLEFILDYKDCNTGQYDILFILISAFYQKLNEIVITT